MKKSRILLLSLSMIVAILNFTGCSDGLTHLVFWDSYYIGVNDLNISRENWYITQAIERFENEHPNVRIDYEIVAHSSETIKKFEMACEAKTGPDIVTLWSSSYAAQVKDYLLPLDSYISEEERNVITGWDTVQFDGVTYGYPTNDSGVQVIYYNKSLIKSAGLDFEKAPPIVFDEFYQACSTLKANDVNTIIYSAIAILLSLPISMLCAFALRLDSRKNLTKTFLFLIVGLHFFPEVITIEPFYRILSLIGAIRNHFAIIIMYIKALLPICDEIDTSQRKMYISREMLIPSKFLDESCIADLEVKIVSAWNLGGGTIFDELAFDFQK